jgi:hypothetical protein
LSSRISFCLFGGFAGVGGTTGGLYSSSLIFSELSDEDDDYDDELSSLRDYTPSFSGLFFS